MASAEVPYLMAGTVAVIGGWSREGRWPRQGVTAVVATIALVLVASVLSGTALDKYVRAIGWLLFAAAIYGWIAGNPAFLRNVKG